MEDRDDRLEGEEQSEEAELAAFRKRVVGKYVLQEAPEDSKTSLPPASRERLEDLRGRLSEHPDDSGEGPVEKQEEGERERLSYVTHDYGKGVVLRVSETDLRDAEFEPREVEEGERQIVELRLREEGAEACGGVRRRNRRRGRGQV
jgi:hypothetical protein